MALKTCKECGKEISESAGRCPHCGARHDYGGYAIALIIAIIIAIIAVQCAHAGELYNCIDRNGNTIVTDSPQDGMTNCALKDSYEDPTPDKTNTKKLHLEYSNKIDEIQRDSERDARKAREASEAWDKKWAKERCKSARKYEKEYRNEWRNAKTQYWTDYYKRQLDDIEETCRTAE